jgi:hypothetical protein
MTAFAGMDYPMKCKNCGFTCRVKIGGGMGFNQITGFCVETGKFVYLQWKRGEKKPEPMAKVWDSATGKMIEVYKCPDCPQPFIMPKCRFCNYDVHPSIGQCPQCGAPMDKPSADLEQQVRLLLDQGQKIEAVKLYKDQTGVGLAEAKEAVEAMQAGAGPPSPPEIGGDLEAELLRLLGQVVQGPEGRGIDRSQAGGRVAGGKSRAGDAAGRVLGRGAGSCGWPQSPLA